MNSTLKTQRRKIVLGGTLMDLLVTMAEGNPGAARVLAEIVQAPDYTGTHNFMTILSLDDMNMRGAQIWVAWKDFCKEDTQALIDKIKTRDPEMVAFVNKHGGTGPELAVEHGGSYQHV